MNIYHVQNVQMYFLRWNHTSHNGDTLSNDVSVVYVGYTLQTQKIMCPHAQYYTNLLHVLCIQQEPAQNLRSALEQKARQQPSSSGPPKRKMKPGQAKTLSDLPQLSA